ncbi:hypothetical protein FRC09_015122, partial [Ceratobasidium sp. 395]
YSQLCRACVDIANGISYIPGPNAVYLGTEEATALLLSARAEPERERTSHTIKVDKYQEGNQPTVRRVPKVSSVLGEQHSFFPVPARSSVGGRLLNNSYQIFCQVKHPNGMDLPLNMAVQNLTNGHPRYRWYGDILILKFLGSRREQYVSTGTWDGDIPNISNFFLTEAIQSQGDN